MVEVMDHGQAVDEEVHSHIIIIETRTQHPHHIETKLAALRYRPIDKVGRGRVVVIVVMVVRVVFVVVVVGAGRVIIGQYGCSLGVGGHQRDIPIAFHD